MGIKYHCLRIGYSVQYFFKSTMRFAKMDLPQLTQFEKRQIKRTWPGITIIPLDYVCARVYKKIHGFSPYYLAPTWYNEMRKKINPKNQLYALENKAMCDIYFPDITFPKVYVRGLNGSYFDADMNYISRDRALAILKSKDHFVIKPAIGTLKGDGVRKIDADLDDVDKVLKDAGDNFIAQEVLIQADIIHQLNPTSLNCFRVTTMYMNGRFDYATSLKVGKKGAVRDNWNCAYWINVNKDGVLSEFGYDYNVDAVDRSDSGIVFKGIVIPHFKDMIFRLESLHKKLFANCGIIGWDVTLDKDYRVVVIETNLYNPGTNIEQYVSGAFFEPFRNDMLNYLKR